MDHKALAEIRELLGDAPPRRDLLIEYRLVSRPRFYAADPSMQGLA